MTRINTNIRPEELCDQHLIAEGCKEIIRIPTHVLKHGIAKNVPCEFKLGSGHVSFFTNKLKYLHRRYNALHREIIRRGYKAKNFEFLWLDNIQTLSSIGAYQDWEETEEARKLLIERINQRIITMNRVTYTQTQKPEWTK